MVIRDEDRKKVEEHNEKKIYRNSQRARLKQRPKEFYTFEVLNKGF